MNEANRNGIDLGRLLLTGATGFVGRAVLPHALDRASSVAVLTRSAERARSLPGSERLRIIEADMTRPSTLTDVCDAIDTVVHCAGHAHAFGASSRESARLHFTTTVVGTKALLESAAKAGVRSFVFISSVKAMGEGSAECLDETAPCAPTTDYGRAKLEAEQAVLQWASEHRRHAAVLRLPLVYGPGSRGNVPRMIAGISEGWFPPLPDVGNNRSMVHVDDVARAALLVARDPRASGRVFIATDGRSYSTAQICDAIRRALGRPSPRWSVPASLLRLAARVGDSIGRIRRRPVPFDSETLDKLLGSALYSNARLVTGLGFQPRYDLFDALPGMVAEHRKARR